MKQKDLMLIGISVFISVILSVVLSGKLISAPKNRQQKVEIVEAIKPEFPTPDSKYFNKDSVDPIQLIQIGNNKNPKPFNDKTQQ